MAADEAVDQPREMCQARPAAVRHGWREDPLCASRANTTVRFHGREVPVCRMHSAMYERWGENAEANAEGTGAGGYSRGARSWARVSRALPPPTASGSIPAIRRVGPRLPHPGPVVPRARRDLGGGLDGRGLIHASGADPSRLEERSGGGDDSRRGRPQRWGQHRGVRRSRGHRSDDI
jgi:hypothetical protein